MTTSPTAPDETTPAAAPGGIADRARHLAAELADQVGHSLHLGELPAFVEQPAVTIDLMLRETDRNDPFYARIVREFHRDARAPHPRLPIAPRLGFGVALCRLPDRFEQYVALIDGSARRNVKKCERDGYRFERIDFNEHLADIAAIRRSTSVRQGPMPEALLAGEVKPVTDPPSLTNVHDYPWFGVLKGDELVAYASCFVAGEACLINHLFGHAAHEAEGVVPRLIVGIAEHVYGHWPRVKYLGYDTYFGASPSLRRFKRKLGFAPYRVRWELGEERHAARARQEPAPIRVEVEEPLSHVAVAIPAHLDYQLVYRLHLGAPILVEPVAGASFHYLDNPAALGLLVGAARHRFSVTALVKALAKLGTADREYYCVVQDGRIVSDGWVTWGRCRNYRIGRGDAVIGPTWTDPARRGRGLATFALRSALKALHARGGAASWIDTSRDNVAMQKAIAHAGFAAPVGVYVRGAEHDG